MNNLFVWSVGVERAVRQVREYAEQRENWYRIGTGKIPGNDARFIVHSGTTRAVFSWTVVPRSWNPRHPPEGSILRYLTISVEGDGRYPRPEACWTLAHHFGFTGASPDAQGICREPALTWTVGANQEEKCAIIQQIVEGVMDGPLPSGVS